MPLSAISPTSSSSGMFPVLKFVQGSEQKDVVMARTPFTVGRKVDKDLVIADPRVSRDHAQISQQGQEFFLEDLGSKHGTFVNGERIQRQKLERGDRLEFGARDSAYVLFNPAQATSNTAREFLSQISGIQIKQEATDLEKLTLFLEAARKLNTAGVLDEILMTMLDVTLQLTGAERAFVFLKDEDGNFAFHPGGVAAVELRIPVDRHQRFARSGRAAEHRGV
jgi:sigma-B regulation protein RsbU (phosphoserine phosphatase)